MTVWSFFKGAFKVVIGFSLLVQSLLFIVLLVATFGIIGGISSQLADKDGAGPTVAIDDGVALVLNPQGVLSEQAPDVDPFEEALSQAFGGSGPANVSVHELVRIVRAAQDDERIDALVLDLGGLYVPSIYASKAYYLAEAIEDFRNAGKRVVAIADAYTQEQYLIASEADTVLLHDQGQAFILGYGTYRTYFFSLLEKLKVNSHVFRVGTFKSALEPYLRDDMSPEAELANAAFLGVLWDAYQARVEENRGLPAGFVGRFTENVPGYLAEAGGNYAAMMKDLGFVDGVMGRADQIAFIRDIVGPGDDDQGFAQVAWTKYRLSVKAPKDRKDADNIAVVTVAGTIVDGEQQSDVAAGDYIAEQLREARERDDVKAVVLRIDSPGGSAFASEVIRDEVLELKKAGKPVIASMGSLAASGGYWVAAPADEIWAAPTTVTGSIGIFGYLPTFENSLAEIGVYTDGVGTTPLAPFTAAGIGPLPEQGETILQMLIEQGYEEFLTVVAEGRNMTKEAVDAVAQGRVWIGDAADDLGLVDKLGDMDDAIAAAAARAGLDDYDVVGMTESKSPFEIFLEELTGSAEEIGLVAKREPQLFAGSVRGKSPLRQIAEAVGDEAAFQASFNDPNAVYARCVVCDWR